MSGESEKIYNLGFLGSFTTIYTFSYENVELFNSGMIMGSGNVLLN